MDSHDDEPLAADMEDEDDDDDDVEGEEEEEVNHLFAQRWTCDACGCNTNHVGSDRNCTICGTSSSSHNNNPASHFGAHFHAGTYHKKTKRCGSYTSGESNTYRSFLSFASPLMLDRTKHRVRLFVLFFLPPLGFVATLRVPNIMGTLIGNW